MEYMQIRKELAMCMAQIVGTANAMLLFLEKNIEPCESNKQILKEQLKKYNELMKEV